ncbi:LDAH hydrolase, partial [Polypterus senegalus]
MPRVPAYLYERALGMLQGGMRTADVARAINCHVRTVRRLRQRYRETGRTADHPRSGRPHVTTPAQDRYIRISHLRDRSQGYSTSPEQEDIHHRAHSCSVLKSVLLFPTIERMAQSPQGKLMTPMLCRLRYAMYVPIYLLSFLPERVKASMVRLLLHRLQTLDESCVSATINLFSVDCTANAMYMGSQEMVQVMDRDNATIQENQEKLIFYYGENDNWCPVQYYEEIKRDFPKADIRLCNKGIRHAFVLDAGRDVALMMTEWLQKVLHSL